MMAQESSSQTPIVSVLMPVYNAERYIEEALESVLNQTFENFEVITVNDGSTDGTLDILRRFEQQDARIRVVSRPNTGIVGALNDGLAVARGEFIARLDADDIALPERFSKQVDYLQNHPECVVVGSFVLLIDSDGNALHVMNLMQTHEEIDPVHIAGGAWQIVHPAVMIRKSAMEQIGGYRDGFPSAEDVDLFMRLAERGEVVNLPIVLTKYRQHLSSAGYASEKVQHNSGFDAINDARARRNLPPVDPNAYNTDLQKRSTLAEHYRKWSWWALNYGNTSTARKYAIAAVKSQPFSVDSWRTVYCSLRGY
jgi:glycosyltransferase involved in cell wall biosynthesis